MDTKTLFDDKSALYASSRPHYPHELFELIEERCSGKQRCWDCATGNGQAAIGLSSIFSEVIATDISREQISNRMERDHIIYAVSEAERTPFPNDHFDCVNVAQALHWFDLERFWQEASRVLRPGGFFITYTYAGSFVNGEISQIIEEKLTPYIYPYWASNNRLCWNGYADVDFPFERMEVPEMEIRTQWDWEQYVDYLHSWSATRRCIDEQGYEFFETASESIKDAWGDTRRTVSTPLAVVCGYQWK